MNKLLGMAGTTIGGGLIGAGVQRTFMASNKIASGFSKLMGKGGYKFDSTTWALLVCGVLVLLMGVYFSSKKR